MSSRWLNERTTADLLGCDISQVSRHAAAGVYGRTRTTLVDNAPHVLISLRGIERATRRFFSEEQLARAIGRDRTPQVVVHVHKTAKQIAAEKMIFGRALPITVPPVKEE
jgi:hypothetical protein